ncbi:MAG: 3'-5' exonuclease, partial [Prevotellaceae bacterium]|nr:3'-5' exonuclease [Prevotellaceae bacterium]
MIENINAEDILFLDIETVPQYPTFDDLPDVYKELWDKKSAYVRKEGETAADVYPRAGIWAEFGRIICISAGFIFDRNGVKTFRVKSFYQDNEVELLDGFKSMLTSFFQKRYRGRLCGHNAKEFDLPYIARRMLINGIKLPPALNIAGLKPWEVPFLDTMELWKFGDYRHYTSLALLTTVMGLPSPKDDIDGSQITHVYYVENDLLRIVRYCEKDALAVAQLFLRYKSEGLIEKL